MKLLFITARFPFPPHKGDQAIPYYRLKLMGNSHEITLLTFYEKPEELEYLDHIKPFCKKIITIKKSAFSSIFNMLTRGLFSTLPLQVLYYKSPVFKKTLNRLLKNESFDLIHVYMLRIAECAIHIDRPKVLELIDSMELNFKRRTENEKKPLKWLFNLELKRLKRYEKEMVKHYDRCIVVADKDREFIGSGNIVTIPLGVDHQTFQPRKSLPMAEREPKLVFTGNMAYFPNRHAILWFLKNCWHRVKSEIKDARLIIAGKDPGKEIRKYHDNDSIEVLGFVDSMAEIINDARLAIAPMQSGSGMQFKILEAMACAVPVVSTTLGLGTIPATHNKSVMIADDAETFANCCINLLKDSNLAQSIADNGLNVMLKNFSWEKNVEQLEEIYRDPSLGTKHIA
jgi:sugar transferase (PEP-CTERM/EpsH1 system associated)